MIQFYIVEVLSLIHITTVKECSLATISKPFTQNMPFNLPVFALIVLTDCKYFSKSQICLSECLNDEFALEILLSFKKLDSWFQSKW